MHFRSVGSRARGKEFKSVGFRLETSEFWVLFEGLFRGSVFGYEGVGSTENNTKILGSFLAT